MLGFYLVGYLIHSYQGRKIYRGFAAKKYIYIRHLREEK